MQGLASRPVHSITLSTAYGTVLQNVDAVDEELPSMLHQLYERAVQNRDAIVTLDGVTHSRNSFLEFVRYFDEYRARATRLEALPARSRSAATAAVGSCGSLAPRASLRPTHRGECGQ